MTEHVAAVVLAAGKSTRMQSDLPKVLHPLAGRPMVRYVLDALRQAGVARVVVVVGYQADRVRAALAGIDGLEFVVQEQQLGTGHAVQTARAALAEHAGPVVVLAGDQPLIRPETIARLIRERQDHDCACVLGSALLDDPTGLGRIVRDADGNFTCIVEQKDTTPEQAAIREINVSCYVFFAPRLWSALDRVRPDNAQKEWYLTDCVAILRNQGHRVTALPVVSAIEALGVNTPEQLEHIEQILAQRQPAPDAPSDRSP